MTQVWRHNPQFKLECSGQSYINDKAFFIQLVHAENNVSYVTAQVNDYQSSKYVDVFDAFNTLDLSLRYGSDAWTKRFTGTITNAAPTLSPQGEVLQIGAWGQGYATVKTHCNTSYGTESKKPTIDTPKEIIDDLITDYIEKSFDGAATGYNFTSKVDNAHVGLSVTFLNSEYDNNFTVINRLCDLTTAYAQGLGVPEVGTHWYVDPSANLYFKKIDADHSDGSWDRYWGGTEGTDPGTQASSTVIVKQDMLLYNFRKHIEDYANKVLLSGKFRKPGWDRWCEYDGVGAGGAGLWGGTDAAITNSGTKIVGSYSIKIMNSHAANPAYAYYPAGQNAAWDLTKIMSEKTTARLGFWVRRNKDLGVQTSLHLHTAANDYYEPYAGFNSLINANDVWTYLEYPIGTLYEDGNDIEKTHWVKVNNADWADINYIQFQLVGGDQTRELYIDDLHFAGLVCREAYSSADITAKNMEFQKVIRNDTAMDDLLREGTPGTTDQGTAAQLAYAELLRRMQTPTVAIIQTPLMVDILPGQTIHPHACQKADGTYRVDADYRVKEIRTLIGKAARYDGFETRLNVTSDVTNSHAFGAPTAYSLLKQYAASLGHAEARDLKGGGLDNLIPRLSEDY